MLLQGRGSAYDDGYAGRPGISPQYPTLFRGLTGVIYPVRPPWLLPGVDYGVGITPGTVLKDPTIDALPPGASVDAGNKRINCNALPDLTFDGYDFSLHGGYWLNRNTVTTRTTLINCKFAVGANNKPIIHSDVGAGSLTLLNCELDGAGINDGIGVLASGGQAAGANFVMKYCWLKNMVADGIKTYKGAHDIRFNLFDSGMWLDGVHSDFIQGNDACESFVVRFNTFYQPAAVEGFPGFLNSAVRYGDFAQGGISRNVDVSYNAMVVVGATGHTGDDPRAGGYLISLSENAANQPSPRAAHNYITYTAGDPECFDFAYPISENNPGSVFADNINLVTGLPFSTTP